MMCKCYTIFIKNLSLYIFVCLFNFRWQESFKNHEVVHYQELLLSSQRGSSYPPPELLEGRSRKIAASSNHPKYMVSTYTGVIKVKLKSVMEANIWDPNSHEAAVRVPVV